MNNQQNLYTANSDVLHLLQHAKKIGWLSIKEQTVQRVTYLAKVLYLFCHRGEDVFDCFRFSVTLYGPHSELINRSLKFLRSSGYIEIVDGTIELIRINNINPMLESKDSDSRSRWIEFIVYILGKYGEPRVFGFSINDPLYLRAVESNLHRELDAGSPENYTILFLNSFRQAFEETLEKDKISSLSSEDYLDLYFEYVFSKIISK